MRRPLPSPMGSFNAPQPSEPSYRVKGILIDGFDSTAKSLRTLFPGARLGFCLRHALNKLPKKLTAIASPVRKTLRAIPHPAVPRAQSLRVFALGQRLRHFATTSRTRQEPAMARGAALVAGQEGRLVCRA